MIKAYKPVGMTPLELLQLTKADGAAYAGRLDPMAEGLMIFLDKDEEKSNRKDFERLKKIYEFDVLLGVQTDSYDILGIPKKITRNNKQETNIKLGQQIQEYPPYSYVRVRGKPLFWWARNNRLDEIEIPEKKINIINFKKISEYKLTSSDLLDYISDRVSKVNGDFRQEEILKAWKSFCLKPQEFECKKFEVECSGGTYVRSLANDMGGVAINIMRTQIGDYKLFDVLHLDNAQKDSQDSHRQNLS